jgi:hypothetical protein
MGRSSRLTYHSGGFVPSDRLESAPDAPRSPAGRVLAALLVLLAGAAILFFVFPGTTDRENTDDAPEPETREPVTAERIAKEREANEAALASKGVKRALASATKGHFAGIAGGEFVGVAETLPGLLEMMDDEGTLAAHRFLFRVGTEGDVTYETTFPYECVVGNRFLAETGLTFRMGRGESTFWQEEGGTPENGQTRRSPDGRPYVYVNVREPHLPREFPAPAGAPARVGGISMTWGHFLVATGFGGPLILSWPWGFSNCEIPGLATVRDSFGGTRVFRRFLVEITVPRTEVHTHAEVLGERLTEPAPLMLGGVEWQRLGDRVYGAACESGKPVLWLVHDVCTGVPSEPFVGEKLPEFLSPYLTVSQVAPWTAGGGIRRHMEQRGFDGTNKASDRWWPEYARPAELLVYQPHPEGNATRFDIVGRLALTHETPPERLEAFLAHRTAHPEAPTETRLVYAITAVGQARDDIIRTMRTGLANGREKMTVEEGGHRVVVSIRHDWGRGVDTVRGLIESGEMIEGEPRLVEVGEYRAGERHGRFESRHPNGQKHLEGTYSSGYRSGEWRAWNENGLSISFPR